MDEIKKYPALAHYFQGVDHIDIKTTDAEVDLRHFIAGMLSYYPWWIVLLYKIRELLVGMLGLVRHERPETLPHIHPQSLSFTPGENATFFIVDQAKENHYWVAVTPEDKHLKAWFGVAAQKLEENRTRFHVFTTITYLHWTGPLYFNIIRPFHHLVLSQMMKAGQNRDRFIKN